MLRMQHWQHHWERRGHWGRALSRTRFDSSSISPLDADAMLRKAKSHSPSRQHLDLEALLSIRTWTRTSPPQLAPSTRSDRIGSARRLASMLHFPSLPSCNGAVEETASGKGDGVG